MKLALSKQATGIINEYFEKHQLNQRNEEFIIAMYQQSVRSWSGYHCQDVVQLIPTSELSKSETFKKYNEFEGKKQLNTPIDVYVEERLFHTLENYDSIMIDVKVTDYFGKKMAQLTIEKLNA